MRNGPADASTRPALKQKPEPVARRRVGYNFSTAAKKNPTAHADCRIPAAFARFSSGQVSATDGRARGPFAPDPQRGQKAIDG